MAICPTGLPMAISPLNRDALIFHLTEYLDHDFMDAVLNIINVGASIGHSGLQKSQSCNNLGWLWTTVLLFRKKYIISCLMGAFMGHSQSHHSQISVAHPWGHLCASTTLSVTSLTITPGPKASQSMMRPQMKKGQSSTIHSHQQWPLYMIQEKDHCWP